MLGANIWTTNDNALYSGALGLSNITKVSKRPLVLVCGAIGTVAALWLYDNFISWLTLLNATLPPIGVILMLDYFLNRKEYRIDKPRLSAVNIGSVTGVIAGALVGNFVHWGIASVNAMAVACACYFACRLILKRK